MSGKLLEIDIDVSEVLKLAGAFGAAADEFKVELERGMNESGLLLTTKAAAGTPVNYGLLRSAIVWPFGFELQQGALMDVVRGIVGAGDYPSVSGVSTSTYVDFVENNTRPHWAPIQPLKLWAIRKLGDERIAYAVQRKIAKKGTRGKHMFRNAWRSGKGQVISIFQRVPEKVMTRLRNRAR